MQLTGTIKHIGARTSREHNGQTYYQQKILVDIPGYNGRVNTIPLEIGAKLQDHMDQYTIGQEVTAHYDYRGSGYVNKQGEPDSFLSLSCWKLDKGQTVQAPQPAQADLSNQWASLTPEEQARLKEYAAAQDPKDLPF